MLSAVDLTCEAKQYNFDIPKGWRVVQLYTPGQSWGRALIPPDGSVHVFFMANFTDMQGPELIAQFYIDCIETVNKTFVELLERYYSLT